MTLQQPRYSPEVADWKGDLLYKTAIRPQVEADNQGEYVAIDIESGAWERDADEDTASERLRQRLPDAQIYVTRIGYGYVRRFGAGRVRHGTLLVR